MACGEAMPDVAELATQVQAAFGEFEALPASVAAAPAPGKKVAATTTRPPAKSVSKVTTSIRASAPKRKRAVR